MPSLCRLKKSAHPPRFVGVFVGVLQVLPLVLELGQDIIWRVRRAVMVSVPLLTERMGVNYFEENLLELYLQVCRTDGSRDGGVRFSNVMMWSSSEHTRISQSCLDSGVSGQRQRGASGRIRRITATVQSLRCGLVARESSPAYPWFLR